jgi:hypothetical protein
MLLFLFFILQADYSPPHLEWFQILRGCEEAGENDDVRMIKW